MSRDRPVLPEHARLRPSPSSFRQPACIAAGPARNQPRLAVLIRSAVIGRPPAVTSCRSPSSRIRPRAVRGRAADVQLHSGTPIGTLHYFPQRRACRHVESPRRADRLSLARRAPDLVHRGALENVGSSQSSGSPRARCRRPADPRGFAFQLPPQPLSYNGVVVSIVWAIEVLLYLPLQHTRAAGPLHGTTVLVAPTVAPIATMPGHHTDSERHRGVADEARMKITRVRPWIVKGPQEHVDGQVADRSEHMAKYVFVQVETDEGLTGWGEITTYPGTHRQPHHRRRPARARRPAPGRRPDPDRGDLAQDLPRLHLPRHARAPSPP